MAERTTKVRVSAQIQDYVAGMEKLAQVTREAGTSAEKLAQKKEAFQQLGAGLAVVGGAMTALSAAVAKTGIEYNTLQQTSRAALNTLLGGAEAANAQMDKLDEFARTSPFSKAVFIEAQQQLLGFGMAAERVVPTLDAIQNAVAATGGSNQDIAELTRIIAQLSGGVKLSAETFNQFGTRGVDAAGIIGEAMGKTGEQIRSEVTAGTLDADKAIQALTDGMQKRFEGAADGVKDTFAGAMDRVQAAWRDMSAELMKPLVDPSGGGGLVDFMNRIADIMRAVQELPEPVKLAGGALFAFTGFVALASGGVIGLTPRVVAMKVAFTALNTTMKGFAIAGGIAVAALTVLVAVIGAVSAAQADAKRRADEYSAALVEGEEATRRYIAEQLALKDSFLWMDRGSAIDNAKKLGIEMDVVTKAVTGTADEYEAFKDKVDEAYAAAGKTLDAGYAMEQLKNKVDDLRDAQALSAEQTRDTDDAAAALEGTLGDTALATEDLEKAAKDAADALDLTAKALDNVGGSAMAMGEAKDAALGAINAMRDAAEAEGVALDGANDESIKYRDSLRDVEGASRDAAEAIIKDGGSIEDAQKAWQDGRDAIIGMLEAKGMDREEAILWAEQQLGSAEEVRSSIDQVRDAWLDLPENVETKYAIEMAEAAQALAELQAMLDAIPDVTYKKVQLDSFTVGNFDVTPNAAGGLYENGIKSFAAGGFEPGIYPHTPGGIHKFAEEHAEGYVSMDPARRGKSEGVWNAIGNRMGFSEQGSSSAAAPQFNVVVSSKGGIDLMKYVDVRVEQSEDQMSSTMRSF